MESINTHGLNICLASLRTSSQCTRSPLNKLRSGDPYICYNRTDGWVSSSHFSDVITPDVVAIKIVPHTYYTAQQIADLIAEHLGAQ